MKITDVKAYVVSSNWCETHCIKTVPHNPLGPVSAAACYLLPDGPGLGIEFDESVAARLPSQDSHCPQLRRADGAFTSW